MKSKHKNCRDGSIPPNPMREFRLKMGKDQVTFAHLLGTSPQVIGVIESGRRRISLTLVEGLINLGADPFELFRLQENFLRWKWRYLRGKE